MEIIANFGGRRQDTNFRENLAMLVGLERAPEPDPKAFKRISDIQSADLTADFDAVEMVGGGGGRGGVMETDTRVCTSILPEDHVFTRHTHTRGMRGG